MKFFLSFLIVLFCFNIISAQESITPADSMSVLIEGSVSIFVTKTRQYYLKKGGTYQLLPPEVKEYTHNSVKVAYPHQRVLFVALIGECKDITLAIKSTKLNDEHLIKLLRKYFKCIGEIHTYEQPSEERSEFRIGGFVGLQSSQLNVKTSVSSYQGIDFKRYNGLTVGGTFEINSVKLKIGAGTQIGFTKYDIEGESNPNSASTRINNKFYSSYSQTQVRVYFKKHFTTKSCDLNLRIGPSLNFNSNFSQKQTVRETLNSGTVIRDSEIDSFFSEAKKSFGIHGALGISKKLNEKLSLDIDVRFEFFNSMNDPSIGNVAFNQTFITPQAGLTYRIK